ncbi:Crp/Fnr family transcriptional regulator [Methylobacterium brachiatum]|jgi:CRP-like cAMP-binding protein|uniref:CRP-like cAMP-binding protein n=1 Tax=Methylobacterium brachiatum TaxID=269660 RepID=A0AAJ1WXS2_9HYPH|nr:Crp/Fnr family transcriptional regulator [Methylobacterium brachiatum]MCB4803839.1 Crp/Fnr family transcriptional regulator [Methylobacterium brachiatum]MDH2311252.1 Crp/Fnr family transcriptional regulator [Methylobacterium brachiatum]MDQ0545095.1 CRP-like cAMP-binding protein [Methylobacterium brachiatum]
MQDALIRKLESFEELTSADREALRGFASRVRQVGARTDLIRENDVPGNVHLILSGYACRYKVLADGQRQIMAYFVPGDFCDLNVFILDQMDHNIGTVSACQVVEIPRQAIEEITARHPRVMRALMWCALVDEAVLREWLVNLGSRPADQRIAHLFCELLLRLEAVGHVNDNSYLFPFTQTDIADTMGLSDVHVNRTIKELRRLDLITLKSRVLTVLDVEQLKTYCGFNPNYLHIRNTRWSGRRQVPWLSSALGG